MVKGYMSSQLNNIWFNIFIVSENQKYIKLMGNYGILKEN